ncbi:PAS domain S-box protein [candidate division KSB1 bacterium]|nr:PAS domain S-box protein [candidate division KSB1 bacterium]
MEIQESDQSRFAELRSRAERKVNQALEQLDRTPYANSQDIKKTMHELQVYQIELEMQNCQLRDTLEQLEASRKKYLDLFEFAPVSYLIFDKKGTICGANLTASAFLKTERSLLSNHSAYSFIPREEHNLLYWHIQKVFDTKEWQTCELKVVAADGTPLYVVLKSMLVDNENGDKPHCRTALIDITERILVEEALSLSENKYRTLVENANEGIAVLQDGKLKFVNPKLTQIMGYYANELYSRLFTEFIHPEDRAGMLNHHPRDISDKSIDENQTFRIIDSADSIKWIQMNSVQITWTGHPATLNFLCDITSRQQAEEHLQNSLEEKELLLREVHHRVKNNMQIISSLLNLQADLIEDQATRQLFKESQNRIKSMALIHEKLYKSENFTRIDFEAYLQDITRQISRSFARSGISFTIRAQKIFIPIDTAIPCGLIVNELVTNALKHAFPKPATGKIYITCKRTNPRAIVLSVADNGIGLPENLNIEQSSTLGLVLIKTLSEQLNAKLEIRRKRGDCFTLTFQEMEENRGVTF